MKVLAQLSVHVLSPQPGVTQGQYAAAVIRIIAEHPSLRYEIHALATDIEGEMDEILAVLTECQRDLHDRLGVDKVHMQLTVMSKRGGNSTTLEESVAKVKRAAS